jgi:hypothetical protein
MVTINKDKAYNKAVSVVQTAPKVPRLCDKNLWPRQSGTIIESLWNGFEVRTAHPYDKEIENLFEALLREFETTNYEVTCSGKDNCGENMLTASIYITEKN